MTKWEFDSKFQPCKNLRFFIKAPTSDFWDIGDTWDIWIHILSTWSKFIKLFSAHFMTVIVISLSEQKSMQWSHKFLDFHHLTMQRIFWLVKMCQKETHIRLSFLWMDFRWKRGRLFWLCLSFCNSCSPNISCSSHENFESSYLRKKLSNVTKFMQQKTLFLH